MSIGTRSGQRTDHFTKTEALLGNSSFRIQNVWAAFRTSTSLTCSHERRGEEAGLAVAKRQDSVLDPLLPYKT